MNTRLLMTLRVTVSTPQSIGACPMGLAGQSDHGGRL